MMHVTVKRVVNKGKACDDEMNAQLGVFPNAANACAQSHGAAAAAAAALPDSCQALAATWPGPT